MANNLHISYDLDGKDRDYAPVIAAIKELGNWAKIEYSFFYVDSTHTAKQACDHVWTKMKDGDRLYVVDATNNVAAWRGLSDEVANHIKGYWHK